MFSYHVTTLTWHLLSRPLLCLSLSLKQEKPHHDFRYPFPQTPLPEVFWNYIYIMPVSEPWQLEWSWNDQRQLCKQAFFFFSVMFESICSWFLHAVICCHSGWLEKRLCLCHPTWPPGSCHSLSWDWLQTINSPTYKISYHFIVEPDNHTVHHKTILEVNQTWKSAHFIEIKPS